MLTMTGITKSFGAVQALKAVDFSVAGGEIVVLLGENGAGKSTLLKTLTGVNSPDSGEIRWRNEVVTIGSPAKATSLGIRMVYQELNLAPHLTVAANICLGNEPTRFGAIDHQGVRERAKQIIEAHRFALNPDSIVGDLGPAQRQLVEICKALAADATLLLLDEPTSSLGEREIEDLFSTLRGLKARGIGIVYVSHRLPECFAIGDRIVVLRDGEKVYESRIAETDTANVVRAMVGRDLASFYPRTTVTSGPVRLVVSGLNVAPRLTEISFTARAGEIVGITGLMGAGRTTLLSALFGLRPADGEVTIDGQKVRLGKGPKGPIAQGIGLITEDRKRTGLALGRSVRENMTLAALKKVCDGGILNHQKDRSTTATMIAKMGVRTDTTETPVGSLSGGNQQKVVMGRWFFAESSVLLLDEPTRGVDVGSKVEIYHRINEATQNQTVVLMVSSELPELLGMSDRILVLFQGRLVADLPRSEATAERVLHYSMTGRDIG